jgi:chromosomal replication initiator protein
LTPSQITGKIRTLQIAMARHISMYLMRTLLDAPFERIGQAVGGKDHSSVMSGVRKVEKMLKSDPNTAKAIKELTDRLKK